MPHIDYFFATISPFTYLAGGRFEAVAAKHGASVTYKPLDIMQLFARTGGTHREEAGHADQPATGILADQWCACGLCDHRGAECGWR